MAVCAGNVVVTEGLDRILSLVEIYIEHQNVKVSLHEHLPMPLDGVDLPSLGPGVGSGLPSLDPDPVGSCGSLCEWARGTYTT